MPHFETHIDIEEIPIECVWACTEGGKNASPMLKHWRKELCITVDRDAAVDCLEGYGAWEDEELAAMSDDEITETILWLACGTFDEYYKEIERAGYEDPDDVPDDFEPNHGSPVFVIE